MDDMTQAKDNAAKKPAAIMSRMNLSIDAIVLGTKTAAATIVLGGETIPNPANGADCIWVGMDYGFTVPKTDDEMLFDIPFTRDCLSDVLSYYNEAEEQIEHGCEWPDINDDDGEFRLGAWSEKSVFYSQYELSASCSTLPCEHPYIYIFRFYSPGPLSMGEPDWDFIAIRPEALRKVVERQKNMSRNTYDELFAQYSQLRTKDFLKAMNYRDNLTDVTKAAISGQYPTEPVCRMHLSHAAFCEQIGADPTKLKTLSIEEWDTWYKENKE